MLTKLFRWALTALLVYAVYTEAGVFTAISVALLSASNEMSAAMFGKLLKR